MPEQITKIQITPRKFKRENLVLIRVNYLYFW